MEVEKIEKMVDTLFKSLYGETLLIDNSIKVQYLGLKETLVNAGGSINIVPVFEIISTNKSFTYEYLFSEIYNKLTKVIKYLGINSRNVDFVFSFDIQPIYLTEEDEMFLNSSFSRLSKLTMLNNGEESGHIDVNPLYVNFEVTDDNELKFNYNFFVKGGEIIMRNGEVMTLPTHFENDVIVEEYIKYSLTSKEITEITEEMLRRIKSMSHEFESVISYLNPEF